MLGGELLYPLLNLRVARVPRTPPAANSIDPLIEQDVKPLSRMATCITRTNSSKSICAAHPATYCAKHNKNRTGRGRPRGNAAHAEWKVYRG